jgi:hypothetical protein
VRPSWLHVGQARGGDQSARAAAHDTQFDSHVAVRPGDPESDSSSDPHAACFPEIDQTSAGEAHVLLVAFVRATQQRPARLAEPWPQRQDVAHPEIINRPIDAGCGRALHQALLNGSGMTVSSYLGQDGYFPRDDLTGLNLALRPATFLEIGNMRNAADAAIQTSPDGRQRIAAVAAAGILAYLGR